MYYLQSLPGGPGHERALFRDTDTVVVMYRGRAASRLIGGRVERRTCLESRSGRRSNEPGGASCDIADGA